MFTEKYYQSHYVDHNVTIAFTSAGGVRPIFPKPRYTYRLLSTLVSVHGAVQRIDDPHEKDKR